MPTAIPSETSEKAVGKTAENSEDFLSPEEILAANDTVTDYVDVTVPEWGGKKVRLRAFTAKEAIDLRETNKGDAAKTGQIREFMIAAIRPDGTPLFDDPKKLGELVKKSWKVFRRFQPIILKLNGFLDDDEAELKIARTFIESKKLNEEYEKFRADARQEKAKNG